MTGTNVANYKPQTITGLAREQMPVCPATGSQRHWLSAGG